MKTILWYVYNAVNAEGVTVEHVVSCGETHFDEYWYDSWLDAMVKVEENCIFFLTEQTTDVWPEWELESEMDFNTVAIRTDSGTLVSHTYDPDCPEGCYGQFDDCKFKED